MKTFAFRLPTHIEFGNGISRRVGEVARFLGGTRVLIVTDRGVRAAGLIDPVVQFLSDAGLFSVVFDDLAPNPREVSVSAGAAVASAEACDLIVAVGGGSPIDTAKGIGLIQTNGGAIAEYEGTDQVRLPMTPLVAVPTTAGSGSEVTCVAVITDADRFRKMTLTSPLLAPRVALVDPELTLGLPRAVTATTGLDALTRAIEAYTALRSQPVADGLALKAVSLLARSLAVAYANGSDLGARYDVMLASMLAGVAFSNSDNGAAHCMAEAAAGFYDLPHGVASAIYLPVVMEYNSIALPDKFGAIADSMGEDVSGRSRRDAARLAVRAIHELSADLNIPSSREVGVRTEDFPRLAATAAENPSSASNARTVTETDFVALFERAYQ